MKSDKYISFKITLNDDQKRVDNIIRKFLPNMPLKSIFKSIRSGDIRINNKKVKQNYKVNLDDILMIYKPLLNNKKNDENEAIKYKLNRDRIIFENEDILIYNKPAGILVHGDKNSLDKQVKHYLSDKVINSLSFSPGPLHRLDRNTSGLMVFSVSLRGARIFTNLLQENKINKTYITIVDGTYTKPEKWEDRISRDEKSLKSYQDNSGQLSISEFTPIFRKNNKTVALIKLITGRTHQIRVQCAIHNRPLVGDIKYNKNTPYNSYYLSAISLTFLQKSVIINDIDNFVLPFKNIKNELINKLLSEKDLAIIDNIIQKELN